VIAYNLELRGQLDLDIVVQIHRLDHRHQVVISVRPPAKNLECQVQLGVRLLGDAP
jgi:hypothetical protein